MKCHYSYYIDKGKKRRVLLPGCMNVVHTNNIKDCTCIDPLTEIQFERQKYNNVVKKLQSMINELQNENKDLMNIIKKLK